MLLDELRHLKSALKESMIGFMDVEVIALDPDCTILRMPHHPLLTSGFHGAALHHGALVGLASTAAFLHALRVTRPTATRVEQWLEGPQPWIMSAMADFQAQALGDVIAEASMTVWDRLKDNSLVIQTALWDDPRGRRLALVTTKHRVPRGNPIPVDVPVRLEL